MSRPRRLAAFLWAAGISLVLVGALGNATIADHIRTVTSNPLLEQVQFGLTFPQWTVTPQGDVKAWAISLGTAVCLVIVVACLAAALAGARSRFAALVAGWGAVILAAAVVGGGEGAVLSFTVYGTSPSNLLVGQTVAGAITTALWHGLLIGWLIGLVLAVLARPGTNAVPTSAIPGWAAPLPAAPSGTPAVPGGTPAGPEPSAAAPATPPWTPMGPATSPTQTMAQPPQDPPTGP